MNIKSNEIKIELNLDLKKIKGLINKSLDIYYESLSHKRTGNFEDSYYNLLLSLNILEIVEKSNAFKNLKNKSLQDLLNNTILKINNSINDVKYELNSYFTDHLNQLINLEIKKKIDSLIILPLKLQSLYAINNKNILICSDDTYSKKFVINYIKKKTKQIPDISIIHQSFKLDLINNHESKKIVVILDDIDNMNNKIIDNLKKISNENVYLICTSRINIQNIPSDIYNIFTETIILNNPDLRDINNFIRYKIFNYLDYKDIFQLKFNVPLLDNKNIEYISQLLFNEKKTYLDIDKIVNIFFEICSKSCLQQNIFFPLKIEDQDTNYYLISYNSIKNFNENNLNKFLYKIPKYHEIIIDNKIYTNIDYLDQKMIINEDRVINELFICNNDIKNKEKYIDMIALVNIEINSENKNKDFDSDFELSKIVLNLYLHYLNHIIVNKDNLKITKYNNQDLLKFINLINNLNIDLFNIDNINNHSILEIKNLFTILDPFLFNLDNKNDIENFLNDTLDKNSYTFFLNIENIKAKLYFSNGNHIEHLHLTKNMDIALEIRKIITKLFDNDVSVEIIKNIDYYLLNIQADEEKDLSNLKIFLNDDLVKKSNTLLIGNEIFDIPDNYCFTNEKDIELLVDKYPKDYSQIYNEDEESWKYTPIKKKEHLDFLRGEYNLRSKFYLNIYNFVLLYQKNNESILSQQQLNILEKIIFDLQMVIDMILYNTNEFEDNEFNNENEDDNSEINNSNVNLVWNNLWNTSYVDKNEDLDFTNDYSYQKKLSKLHKKFYIDKYFLTRILELFSSQNNQSIYSFYIIYKNKIENKSINQELFLKSKIEISKNQNNLYSEYYINCYPKINKKIIENTIFKLNNQNSLYFAMFENLESIMIKNNNQMKCYKINDASSLKLLEQIGRNIIKKENQMSLFKINNSTNSIILSKWINSFIISSISSFNQKYKFTNLFLACILYKDYVTNNNNNLNIIDLLNSESYIQQIINKINYFYSLNENEYIVENKKIFEDLSCNIELKYSSQKDFKHNNQILDKFKISNDNFNLFIRNFNLKKDYFQEALFKYNL